MNLDGQTLLIIGTPNANGRIYTQECVESMVKQFNAMTKPMFGELGTQPGPAYGTIDINRVSHVAKDLRIEDGKLVANIEVLDTPFGKILQVVANTAKIDMDCVVHFRTECYIAPQDMVLEADGTTTLRNVTFYSVSATNNPA